VDVVIDLASLAYNHVFRQRSIARDAGCITANVAWGRQQLDDVIASLEIHIAGLWAALLSYR
jgi:hypothetical protein